MLACVSAGLAFLLTLVILGSPKSSLSSSSLSSYVGSPSPSSSSSSAFQSSCVWEMKSLYVRGNGGFDRPAPDLVGAGDLGPRLLLWEEIGGVLGLELLDDNELQVQISERALPCGTTCGSQRIIFQYICMRVGCANHHTWVITLLRLASIVRWAISPEGRCRSTSFSSLPIRGARRVNGRGLQSSCILL